MIFMAFLRWGDTISHPSRGAPMVATDKLFAGSIPEIYDRFLVPLIFEPYAVDLAGRVAALAPNDVLETAAGTGVLTRALGKQLPASTHIVATDLNQPMLDQAARRQHAGAVEWKQADALALPFADASFDAVACQFGVMFFPDKVQGYKEARRVLRPGGRFLFSVWDDIAENEFADVVTQVLAEVFPGDPPRFMARTPHGHHDVERIRQDLKAAGFADVAIEAVDARSRAPSARHVAVAYCQGTPLRNEIEARDASRLEEATSRAAAAVAQRFGTAAVDGRIRAIVITAS
jgi:ubiquinone/menaquinone biosynthesis C-methylase UbiE